MRIDLAEKRNKGFILMKTNYAIVSNSNHPLYEKLKVLNIPFYECNQCFESQRDWSAYKFIFDFTILSTEEKNKLLNSVTIPTISDLTFNWGDFLAENCSNLHAAMATGLHSPKNTYEIWYKNGSEFKDELSSSINDLFKQLEINTHETAILGFGFTFPRIVSQIINEAYFASEDQLATNEDIDTAMKFGVNYPLGPIEWSQKTSLSNIGNYLKELYHYTGEARYRPSLTLQKATL